MVHPGGATLHSLVGVLISEFQHAAEESLDGKEEPCGKW